MKKFIFAIALLFPLITFASIDVNLKYGSQGPAVFELQDFLASKGFLSIAPNGYFFSLTRKAVIAYQKSVGLPRSGYVGTATRAQINAEITLANAPAVQAEIAETGTSQPSQPVAQNQTAPAPVAPSPTVTAPVQPTTQTASVIQSVQSYPAGSYVLPSGVVVGPNGAIITTSAKTPTQTQSTGPVDDQTAGKNYFKAHNTCVGLQDINNVQYNSCVGYAFALANSQVANQATTTAVTSTSPAPTCSLQTSPAGGLSIIWFTSNTTQLNLYGYQAQTLIQALTPIAGGQLSTGLSPTMLPIKIVATGPGGTATCGVAFMGQTSNGQ